MSSYSLTHANFLTLSGMIGWSLSNTPSLAPFGMTKIDLDCLAAERPERFSNAIAASDAYLLALAATIYDPVPQVNRIFDADGATLFIERMSLRKNLFRIAGPRLIAFRIERLNLPESELAVVQSQFNLDSVASAYNMFIKIEELGVSPVAEVDSYAE